MISKALFDLICQEFAMDYQRSIHGLAHWQRVHENGLRLTKLTGANPAVVELFAFLHDVRRCNDSLDPGHGQRAADFIHTLRGSLLVLPNDDFELLVFACAHHTDGLTQADVTVQTCWDADRLDLGRVGIKPLGKRLCTPAAQDPELIEWAYRRSLQGKT